MPEVLVYNRFKEFWQEAYIYFPAWTKEKLPGEYNRIHDIFVNLVNQMVDDWDTKSISSLSGIFDISFKKLYGGKESR